jgi:hypothetical protein
MMNCIDCMSGVDTFSHCYCHFPAISAAHKSLVDFDVNQNRDVPTFVRLVLTQLGYPVR